MPQGLSQIEVSCRVLYLKLSCHVDQEGVKVGVGGCLYGHSCISIILSTSFPKLKNFQGRNMSWQVKDSHLLIRLVTFYLLKLGIYQWAYVMIGLQLGLQTEGEKLKPWFANYRYIVFWINVWPIIILILWQCVDLQVHRICKQ